MTAPLSNGSRWTFVADHPLAELRPAPGNPRTHPPEQLERLERSLGAFGWVNPILADPSGEIIAGEARWRAGLARGDEVAPVIVIAGLSALEAEAYRVADNRLAEGAGWDEDKLRAVLERLQAGAADVAAVGFSEAEVAELLAVPPSSDVDPDEVPELPEVPVTQPGDLWLLGSHRVICGDSTKPETFATLMGGRLATTAVIDSAVADLVFTDPPYGMSYRGHTHGGIKGDDKRGEALVALVRDAIAQARENARAEASFYVCLTWRTYTEFLEAISAAGLSLSACIVWDKGAIGHGAMDYRPRHEFIFYCRGTRWYGGRAEADVWSYSRDAARDYVHPTQKPVELIERAILNSTRRGDVVLDVFGGSGSTLIACERQGRIARLVELDPRYCDAMVERWKRLTGRDPIRQPSLTSASA